MADHPELPPRPGDPRSRGPRPRARWRDVAWAAAALALVGLTAAQLSRVAYLAATDPEATLTGGRLLLAFGITVVWLLTVYWLAAGAWRRSVWGCPFEHTEDASAARRCPRHGTVTAAGGPTSAVEAGDRPADRRG